MRRAVTVLKNENAEAQRLQDAEPPPSWDEATLRSLRPVVRVWHPVLPPLHQVPGDERGQEGHRGHPFRVLFACPAMPAQIGGHLVRLPLARH